GTVTITDTNIRSNTSTTKGGGIYIEGGSVIISNTSGVDSAVSYYISGNSSAEGGGLYLYNCSFTIGDAAGAAITDIAGGYNITGNTATGSGGGIYLAGSSTATVAMTTVGNNTAGINGGGIYNNSNSLDLINTTVSGNTAANRGGGIYFANSGSLTLTYVTVANNIASYGGSSAVATDGGGVYMYRGNLELLDSIVAQNWSVAADTTNGAHSDISLTTSAGITSADYSIIGTVYQGSSSYEISTYSHLYDVSGTYTYDTGTYTWSDLGISNTLEDNGGWTLTLYVYNGSLAIGNGSPYPAGTSDVYFDQRGVSRVHPDGTATTIGAYEKPSSTESTYYYIGGNVDNASNWVNEYSVAAENFTAPDQTFVFYDYFNTGYTTVTINADTLSSGTTFTIGSKNTLDIGIEGGTTDIAVTIDAGYGINANLGNIYADSSLTVDGSFITQLSNLITELFGELTVNSSGTDTYTGGVALATGALLTIAAADANVTNLTISSIDAGTTVKYTYAGDQTIRIPESGNYYNLELSGDGNKLSSVSLTVNGDLTLADNVTLLVEAGDLNVSGAVSGTGSIEAQTGSIAFNSTASLTGNINTSGDISIVDSATITGNLTASAGNVTFYGNVDVTGNISAVNGTIILGDTGADTILLTDSVVTANTISIAGNLTLDNASVTGTASLTANRNITAQGGDNLLASADLNINTSSYYVTVNGADTTLTLNVGAENVLINDTGTGSGKVFDVNNIRVGDSSTDTGTIAFVTTGDAELDFGGTSADGIYGTLSVSANLITLTEVVLNNGYLELNNQQPINLGGDVVVNGIIFNGAVNLIADSSVTGTKKSVEFNGLITGNNYNLTISAATTAAVGEITGLGALNITGAAVNMNGSITATGIEVNGPATIGADATFTSSGDVIMNGTTAINGDISIISNDLTFIGLVSGNGNLTLSTNGTGTFIAGADLDGDLTLSSGRFSADGVDVTSGNLNIAGTALLEMTADTLTANNNIINNGTLVSGGTVVAGSDFINSGVFTAYITTVGGNITNTGIMTVTSTLNLTGSGSVSLDLDGMVDLETATLNVAAGKNPVLTNGNLVVKDFAFLGANSTFELNPGVTLEITGNFTYAVAQGINDNYFIVPESSALIRIMDGSDVEYRVGDNNYAIVVTLSGTSGEKIAVGVIDGVTVNGETITGIEDTVKFTTIIDRNYGGTSYTNDLILGINWPTAIEGTGFDPSDASLFSFSSGEWTIDGPLTITDPSAGRHEFSNYLLTHNGTYTIANTNVDPTVPPVPNNVNIYEMANPHFMPMYTDLDTNILLHFEIGWYPYFTSDLWLTPENSDSIGQAVYRQMEYRLISSPLTNPLYGQVPQAGEVLGQAITEQANLTLTDDAPIYLEVNGEYSVGAGWLPITEPATVENIEQFHEPVTQGQIDQFYLDFGDREDIFEKAAPFKSDLDEMLDNLLAG
ncbi:MAG: choice-of-anchor Q domain-containing protein, partial [Victivallaceae bacterium]|nr:choice-of-anchor Q domain-containing protein [Victivallaceae bacterium]